MSPFCPPAYVRLVLFVPLFSAMYYSLKIRGQTVPLSYSTNSYRMYYRRDTIAKLSRHGAPVHKSAKIVRMFVGLCLCQSCALIKTCCRVKKDKFSVSDVSTTPITRTESHLNEVEVRGYASYALIFLHVNNALILYSYLMFSLL